MGKRGGIWHLRELVKLFGIRSGPLRKAAVELQAERGSLKMASIGVSHSWSLQARDLPVAGHLTQLSRELSSLLEPRHPHTTHG